MASTNQRTDTQSAPDRDFREELSQLIQQHLAAGASPATVVDALELQTEVVRSKGPGTVSERGPSAPQDDHLSRE